MKDFILAALAAVGGAIAWALGGWDSALIVLLSMMGADYLTGLMLAIIWKNSPKSESGRFASSESFKGLARKLLVLLLVWVGTMLDRVIGADYVRTTVILFFIANEGLSILENTALMGVPYPSFIKNILEVMKDRNDKGEADEP